MTVGIDDLNVWGSTLAVDARAILAARGTPLQQADTLGLVRRSLAAPWEDPVTLAVNAAAPIVAAVGKDAFQLLIVGSESSFDSAKPLSSYVQRHLGLSERTFHVETKHACFSATAGLKLAAAWVAAHPGQRALVIATDMARKIFGHPAEALMGAGAVAMSVSADPRLLAFEPHEGFASREVYDVMRPTPVLEVSHANLSLAAYLDLLEIAWEGYCETAGSDALHRLDHLAFHTPVIPLVRQAHGLLADGRVPSVPEHFERFVGPSLTYNRELGNIYSGSLYAALAGVIDHGEPVPGARVGMYSYGSGSGACYSSGIVQPGARALLARHAIGAHLAERRLVDVPTYEQIVLAQEQSLTQPAFTPDLVGVPGLFAQAYEGRRRLVLEHVRDFYRSYTWT